jgi:transposase
VIRLCCQRFWVSCGSTATVPAGLARPRSRCGKTRRTPPADTELCCARAGSPRSFPSRLTRSPTASARGAAGGRPVTLDAEDYKGRNVVERFFNRMKNWRGLASRYDKLAVVFRGSVILAAIVDWLR